MSTWDDVLGYSGGTLRVGETLQHFEDDDEEYLLRIATWEGSQFGVFTSMYGGEASDLVGVMSALEIDETEHGVVAQPKNSAVTPILRSGPSKVPRMAKKIPDLGIVQIRQMTPDTLVILPPWAGMEVDGGELFSADNDVFILANDTAYTKIYTEGVEVEETTLLDNLSSIVLEWQSG